MRTLRATLLLATALLLSSCGRNELAGLPAGYCTSVSSIAIVVDVQDAVTAQPLAAAAHGTIRHGTTTEALTFSNARALFGGTELGTYEVAVQVDGYQGWTKTGVAVTQRGPCGNVIPVQLLANLVPVP